MGEGVTSGITSETLLFWIAAIAILAPIIAAPVAEAVKWSREKKQASHSKLDQLADGLLECLALELSTVQTGLRKADPHGVYKEMADLRAAFYRWARFVEPYVAERDRREIEEAGNLILQVSGRSLSEDTSLSTGRLVQRVTIIVSKKL